MASWNSASLSGWMDVVQRRRTSLSIQFEPMQFEPMQRHGTRPPCGAAGSHSMSAHPSTPLVPPNPLNLTATNQPLSPPPCGWIGDAAHSFSMCSPGEFIAQKDEDEFINNACFTCPSPLSSQLQSSTGWFRTVHLRLAVHTSCANASNKLSPCPSQTNA